MVRVALDGEPVDASNALSESESVSFCSGVVSLTTGSVTVLFDESPAGHVTKRSPLTRAILARGVSLYVVNAPPMTTLPFGCKATADTPKNGPVPTLNDASSEPPVLSRTRVVGFMLVEVAAPTMILPSGCKAIAPTSISVAKPGLNDASRDPLELTRTRPLTAVPL